MNLTIFAATGGIGRRAQTAARPRRGAADRDCRRDRARPVLHVCHLHPPACMRLLSDVRPGDRVPSAKRSRASAGTGFVWPRRRGCLS